MAPDADSSPGALHRVAAHVVLARSRSTATRRTALRASTLAALDEPALAVSSSHGHAFAVRGGAAAFDDRPRGRRAIPFETLAVKAAAVVFLALLVVATEIALELPPVRSPLLNRERRRLSARAALARLAGAVGFDEVEVGGTGAGHRGGKGHRAGAPERLTSARKPRSMPRRRPAIARASAPWQNDR
ncbi:MAG TPA: hypothetical protein VK989_00650, partial [Polyangia bacterium]|nr:hypothetical protein [Polyangia bacterium]